MLPAIRVTEIYDSLTQRQNHRPRYQVYVNCWAIVEVERSAMVSGANSAQKLGGLEFGKN